MTAVGVIVISVIIGVSLLIGEKMWQAEVAEPRERIKQRQSHKLVDIYDDWSGQTMYPFEQFCHVWEQIAERIGLPPEKLRPSDRFDNELKWLSSRFEGSFIMVDLIEWICNEGDNESIKTFRSKNSLNTLGELAVFLAKSEAVRDGM